MSEKDDNKRSPKITEYVNVVTLDERSFEFQTIKKVIKTDFQEIEYKGTLFDDAINAMLDNDYIIIKYEPRCWDNYSQRHFMKVVLGRLKV